MTKRFNLTRTAIDRRINSKEGEVLVGHPCGYIAPASYLRKRPKMSRAVAHYLTGDASFAGDFESMLITMGLCGCELPRSTWRHIKHWVAKGCPHWKQNSAFSAAMLWWWKRYAWCFVPNRNEYCQDALEAAEYYRELAYLDLVKLEEALSGN